MRTMLQVGVAMTVIPPLLAAETRHAAADWRTVARGSLRSLCGASFINTFEQYMYIRNACTSAIHVAIVMHMVFLT